MKTSCAQTVPRDVRSLHPVLALSRDSRCTLSTRACSKISAPAFTRRPRESRHIPRRIASGADFIHHAAVIDGRSDLSDQFILLHDAELVIELALDDLRLPLVVIEMLLLAGHFEMPAAGEVAVDRYLRRQFVPRSPSKPTRPHTCAASVRARTWRSAC